MILLCLVSAAWSTSTLKIVITGINGEVLTNAQSRLQAWQKNQLATLNYTEAQQLCQQGEKELVIALQAYAYFKPHIVSHLERQDQQWLITYQVSAGPPLLITKLDLQILGSGQNDPQLKQVLAHFPIQEQQAMLTENYNKAKKALFDTALKQGYLKASFQKSKIAIDLQHYTAVVILHFATGERYYFGLVNFGKTPLRNDFLQKFLTFKTGEPYLADKLLESQRNLTNSDYFEQVSLHPELQVIDTDQVPITSIISLKKSQQYKFGMGYGTDTGIRGTLGFQWKPINDTGQWFNTTLQGSERQSNLNANYVIPGSDPMTEQYTFGGFYQDENPIDNGQSTIKNLHAGYTTSFWGWQQSYTLNLQQERYQVEEGDEPKNSFVVMPSVTWTRTRSDNPVFVTDGYRLSVNARGADRGLFSSSSFIQTDLQAKYIHSITNASRIILRSEFGYTVVNDLDSLPRSLRFFAGGTQSLRGYNYQELGPARYLLTVSAEYQQQIVGKWYAAAFYDTGNAFNQFPPNLQQAPGLGVVWISPVGTLELTLAKAINKPGEPIKVQFSMGADL